VRPAARLLILASAIACAAAAPAAEPLRRAGLWDQQLTIDDGSYAIPLSQMCIDAKTAPRLTIVGAQMDRSQCETYALAPRAEGGWSFRSSAS